MRKWLVLAVAGAVFALGAQSPAQEAVFLVRHAEKVDESKDAALSDVGRARAEALARHLGGAGVRAIYATQYQRTQNTAAPLAAALGIKTTIVDADASGELVRTIRRKNAHDVVLVVGHSDSVPEVIGLLGCKEKIEIRSGDYDNLFVVVPRAGRGRSLLRLKY